MKQSVLVPMLVAMFGAEVGAQMPAPPDDNRTVGATVAAKSAAAVIQEQPAYAASFVSQSVPSTITFQTPAPVVVTMRNTGTATWVKSDGDVFLATQEPQDNYYWCIQDNRYGSRSGNRVLLPYDVAPGQQVTFNFIVKPLSCFFRGAGTSAFSHALAHARHIRRGDARSQGHGDHRGGIRIAAGSGDDGRRIFGCGQRDIQEHDQRYLDFRRRLQPGLGGSLGQHDMGPQHGSAPRAGRARRVGDVHLFRGRAHDARQL